MVTPEERSRLEKLLGMLASSFDGERANAARMIAAMADKHKMTVVELVMGTPKPETKTMTKAKRRRTVDSVMETLREIDDAPEADLKHVITAWEMNFVSDVCLQYEEDYELSDKQMQVAQRIIRKVSRYFDLSEEED